MRPLKTYLRNLIKYRLNSAIIIISLAVGVSCANLIFIFVSKEFNVDGFQKNRNQIFALLADDPFFKGKKMYYIRYGAAEYMKNNFSEVKDLCRISNTKSIKVIVGTQNFFDSPKIMSASANFFDFFSYPLVLNTPKNVLATDHDIVISQEMALKYFGKSNPIGQIIKLVTRDSQYDMVVTGVFIKPEESSQLNFDMVRLIGEVDSHCYLLLSENTNINLLEEKFEKNKASIPIIHDGTPGTHFLKDMREAYFDSARGWAIEKSRNKADLTIAIIISLMILAVTLFNYLGLINNRLIERVRAFTIHRINGSSKQGLVTGFTSETSILIVVAFIISILIMIWIVPFFNHITSSSIKLSYIFKPENCVLMSGIPVLVLISSYLFSFFRIRSGIQIETIKSGNFKWIGKNHVPVFNIIQMIIAIVLIASSIAVLKQVNFIINKKIGLNKDVHEVKLPDEYKNLASVFKAEIEKEPSVEIVSVADASPVLEHWAILLDYDDNGEKKQYTPCGFVGDKNYVKTLGIKIAKGEDFSSDETFNKNKCIINESLAKLFTGQNLIGKELPGNKGTTVIGIAKDFHYGSLKEIIEPGYIVCGESGYHLMVAPSKGQALQARKAVLKIWDKLIPDYPVNMESIGERYEWMHRENANYAKLIWGCCLVSVLLSMIGLFAVSYHTCRRRTKEIGIRKVNGGRLIEVVTSLNFDFITWIGVAFIIACPFSWYAMDKWLQNFAYKTELSWWIFGVAGVISFVVAVLTISWQSYKTASRNPVESLRYE